MTSLTVISPPAEPAVPLSQVKAFLRIGHEGEDTLVTGLIEAATQRVETAGDLALVTRSLRLTLPRWPQRLVLQGLRLSPVPVQSLQAVRVFDEAGASTDLTDRFELIEHRLCLRPWQTVAAVPSGGRIEIEYIAGFGEQAAIPADLVQAVMRLCAMAYSQGRGDGQTALRQDLPDDVESILKSYRRVRL